MLTNEEMQQTLLESHENIHKRLRRIELLVGGIGGICIALLWRLAEHFHLSLFGWL